MCYPFENLTEEYNQDYAARYQTLPARKAGLLLPNVYLQSS